MISILIQDEGRRPMNVEIAMSLTAFAFATLFLPGPNNLLLMASSANFGWRSTVPHIMGAVGGATLLMAFSVLGVSEVALKLPALVTAIKYGGAAWLMWFGKTYIMSARGNADGEAVDGRIEAKPFSFKQAAMFQWMNPSALIFTFAIAGAFAGIADTTFLRCLSICTIFAAVALLATSTWTTLGQPLAVLFTSPRTGSLARMAMGGLIIIIAIKLALQ